MKIVCIGYGRLGAQVVQRLQAENHDIVVVDKDPSVLERRSRDTRARFLFGNAIDADVLREAGAAEAGALFALTRDENTNLMVAQVARLVFNVPRIITVVYDPAREATYLAAGIETLPLTVAGAEYLVSRLKEIPERRISLKEAWERGGGHAAEVPVPELVSSARPADQPFYVVVVGGGRVGYFLTKALLENNMEVTIIEESQKIYSLVSRQVDCPVIRGDGSSVAVQEQAGVGRANVFVAVSNHDHDNLIACQIAKNRFGVPKTIARVKNPRNEVVMQKLGVDVTVSSTAMMRDIIQSELPTSRIRTVLDFRTGELELMEYHLDTDSPVAGRCLRELEFPADCSVVTILRNATAIIPRGDTVLENGDILLALVKMGAEPALRQFLLGSL